MDRQAQMRIANLISRQQRFQDQIGRKEEAIANLNDDVTKLRDEVHKLETAINVIRAKEAKRDAEEAEKETEMEEEADAATTTASLDAASTSSGGNFGGWRHYDKIGDTKTRCKKDKKKKKCYDFLNRIWNNNGEE